MMNNTIKIHMELFPVMVYDHRNGGNEVAITVPVTKEQLHAAQLVGQSSTELIERLCERQGYTVTAIGRNTDLPINLDLDLLVKKCLHHVEDAFDYCRGEEKTTTIEALENFMGMGQRTIRKLLKQHGGFWINAGTVCRKEAVQ